jgi:hypothetical protein
MYCCPTYCGRAGADQQKLFRLPLPGLPEGPKKQVCIFQRKNVLEIRG